MPHVTRILRVISVNWWKYFKKYKHSPCFFVFYVAWLFTCLFILLIIILNYAQCTYSVSWNSSHSYVKTAEWGEFVHEKNDWWAPGILLKQSGN